MDEWAACLGGFLLILGLLTLGTLAPHIDRAVRRMRRARR